MGWTVETVSAVEAEIEALPVKLSARLVRLLEAVENAAWRRFAARTPSISTASSGSCGSEPREESPEGST